MARFSNRVFRHLLFSFSKYVKLALFPVLLLAAGCSMPGQGNSNSDGVSMMLDPAVANVTPGGTLQFTALLHGTSDTSVHWHASAGSISTSGLFTAPTSAPGTVTVTAFSSAIPSVQATAHVTLGSSALSVSTLTMPPALLSSSYAAALTADGGAMPYKWSIGSGSIPSGVALDSSTGVLSGTPGQSGSFNFVASVTDALHHSASQNLTLAVEASGSFDGPAELPRVYMASTLADTPAAGSTVAVAAGGDLQAALDAANCGDTITLQAGATFGGVYRFPNKPCDDSNWIIVRTSAPDSSLPPEGTRLTPCYAGVASLPGRPSFHCAAVNNVLAKIIVNQAAPDGPIFFEQGANHYRFIGLEITRAVPQLHMRDLVETDGNTTSAHHLVFDRLWVHGTATDETKGGVHLTGITYAAIVDSYFTDFHCIAISGTCTDAQAINGGGGDQPGGTYLIQNNFLEASGQSIMFGGAGGTITPTDIVIRGNHLFKPLLWMPGQAGFVGGYSGHPFIVKNNFELKNAQRLLFENNIVENNWGGFTQHGFSIVLTPADQGDNCPSCEVTDVTIRYSTISHAGAGMNISNALTKTGTHALAGARYSIHDITIDDINAQHYNGYGTLFLVMNHWSVNPLNNVVINHVTGFSDPGHPVLALADPTYDPKMWGFSIINSIVGQGRQTVVSAGAVSNCASYLPLPSLRLCFSSYAFNHNVIIGSMDANNASVWPSGNHFATTSGTVGFAKFNSGVGGNYQLVSTSLYTNAASDGKNIGADITGLQSAIANVY